MQIENCDAVVTAVPGDLCEVLIGRERELGEQVAYTMLGDYGEETRRITYAGLAKRARAIAAELQARGTEGERALLLYPAGFEFVAAFFGCLLAGVVAVPAPPPESSRQKRSAQRLHSIIHDCDARIILTASATAANVMAMLAEGQAAIECLDTEGIPNSVHTSHQISKLSGSRLAYLQYTSGSTSTPKGIEITHANLCHHLVSLQRICRYDAKSVTITWMPNFHDWGLIEGLLLPLINGHPCYILSPFTFIRRPGNWLAAITQYHGTHSQGPSFAYEHCLRRIDDGQLSAFDLSAWRAAGIAAEPINFPVMREFHRRFSGCGFRWQTFCPAYGLGEATLMVSFCDPDESASALGVDATALECNQVVVQADSSQSRTIVCCGTVYDDTDLQIVDPVTSHALPDDCVGEVWLRSPAVAQGYWRRPDDTAETFQGKIATSTAGSFLRTGDLGFLRDRQLYITGRLKDLIIIRGSNHYPQDIEWTAQRSHLAAHGQTSAAFSIIADESERLVVLQEIDRAAGEPAAFSEILARIVQAIVEQHEIDVYHLMVLKRGSILRTASGKIQRRANRKAYLNGEFQAVAEWRGSNRTRVNGDSAPIESSKVETNVTTCTQSQADPIPITTADDLTTWLRTYAARRINSRLMDERRSVPPNVVMDFGNHGLFGLQVPRKYGGLGLGHREMLRVIEQLAAIDVSLATLVFLSNTNGLRPIVNFAHDATKAHLLPGMATGRQLAAFGLTEPEAGANIGAIQTTAVRQPAGGVRITGCKRWNGSAWCNWITVIAREVDRDGSRVGISAFLVPIDAPGVVIGEEALTSGLRAIVQNKLTLDAVELSDEMRLGTAGAGLEVANDAFYIGRLCVVAVATGAMKRCLQLLYRYATVRQISTGRLIDHPHVMSRVHEMACKLDALETVSKYLAMRLDQFDNPPAWIMMAAKVAASDWLNEASATTVQLLGGRGYMENNEVSRIWRDAKALSIGEGPNESLVGYLGQVRVADEVNDWLASHSATEDCAEFLQTRAAIVEDCGRLNGLNVAQREQWTNYLTGMLVVRTFIHAVLNIEPGPVMASTRQWSSNQVCTIRTEIRRMASQGPDLCNWFQAQSYLLGITDSIGDVIRILPGEDDKVDPLLEPNTVQSAATGQVATTPTNTNESAPRRQLEFALRRLLTSDPHRET